MLGQRLGACLEAALPDAEDELRALEVPDPEQVHEIVRHRRPGTPRLRLDRVVLDDVAASSIANAAGSGADVVFISTRPPVLLSRCVNTPVMWPGILPVWPTKVRSPERIAHEPEPEGADPPLAVDHDLRLAHLRECRAQDLGDRVGHERRPAGHVVGRAGQSAARRERLEVEDRLQDGYVGVRWDVVAGDRAAGRADRRTTHLERVEDRALRASYQSRPSIRATTSPSIENTRLE